MKSRKSLIYLIIVVVTIALTNFTQSIKAQTLEPSATEVSRVTLEPHATLKPSLTSEPSPTSEPSATSEPSPTSEPSATSEPSPTSEPSATSEPSPTSEPNPTNQPSATIQPSATNTPGATSAPSATSVPSASATNEPSATSVPSASATNEPSATVSQAGDFYENDTPPNQAGYAGAQTRTFSPAGDVDYVRYLLKANLLTWFETYNLQSGADTELKIYRDDDGILTNADPLLVSDDDSGQDLGSLTQLIRGNDTWLTIVIQNNGTGWGEEVEYAFSITTKEEQTATPTETPPAENTPTHTENTSRDSYEEDSPPNQPGYAGPQTRTFSPTDDVDYVRYFLKADLLTWFETSNLTNAADTVLEIYQDTDGILTNDDPLLANDDDSGEGLASRTSLIVETDTWLTIVIRNNGTGWGEDVEYTFNAITAEELPPTQTPTINPTGTQINSEDTYENDTPPNQAGYAGPQQRTFNPAGDVDYVRYLLKANLPTWIETSNLIGGADTLLEIYHDTDGILTVADLLLVSDDDGGSALGSSVSIQAQADLWLTIVIRNKGTGWGENVAYTLSIVTSEDATPTPTITPTITKTPKDTQTPGPTSTPTTPSPTPTETAIPTTTRHASVAKTPTITPTPSDVYENDALNMPGYAGAQQRTFNPVGDVDYVRYHAKAGLRVWFETTNLTNAADTEILVHRDDYGTLLEVPLVASDDDGGSGLSSRLSYQAEQDQWLTIVIRNRSSAWGQNVGYVFRAGAEEEITPTATPTAPATSASTAPTAPQPNVPAPAPPPSLPAPAPQPNVPAPAPEPSVPAPAQAPVRDSATNQFPTDKHENDAPPNIALYSGPQQRIFNPYGDVDYVQYFLKENLTTWFETKNLTGAADTKISLIHDANENKTIDDDETWLIDDDDSGEGLGSKLSVTKPQDTWLIIKIENRSTSWGQNSSYILEITTAEEMTPIPPAAPTGYAGPYLPEPSEPSPSLPKPQPIPTLPIPQPPVPAAEASEAPPEAEESLIIQPDPLINPTSLKVEIFLDLNNDNIMNWGEEIDDILVYLTTPNRSWNTEAYTIDGEVLIPITSAPTDSELIVIVPYLHRSGVVKIEENDVKTKINLDMPELPSFLP